MKQLSCAMNLRFFRRRPNAYANKTAKLLGLDISK